MALFTDRLIRFPLKLVPSNIPMPVFTGINKGMHWMTGSGPTNRCWIGNYESDRFAALREVVRPGTIAYDIGANAGYYTLAFSRLVGDAGHVFSFEPDATNAKAMRRHIAMNNLNNVTFVQVAISDSIGMVGFREAQGEASGKIGSPCSYMVPSLSLDDFVAAGNPLPSFVKMDIEGAEQLALSGAKALLSAARATWMIETHSAQLRDDCQAMMARYGYRFTGFDCRGDAGDRWDFMALPPAS